MKGRIVWKFVATVLLVAWAVSNLNPIQDRDFIEYARGQVETDVEGFDALVEDAQERLASDEARTLYLALREEANLQRIDLQSRFYPGTGMVTRNLERKNEAMLSYLLRKSKANLRLGLDLAGGTAFTLRINEEVGDENAAQDRLDKAVEIMRKRIDGLGVAEPLIRPVPPNRLEIQLPGLDLEKDPGAADALQKAARLDFRTVWRGGFPPADAVPGTVERLPLEPWKQDSPTVPYEVMTLERESDTGEIVEEKFYVRVRPEFSGEVNKAQPYLAPNGQYWIALDFTDRGGRAFAEATTEIDEIDQQTGRKGLFAIVLDGRLYSALSLREGAITGGSATISGDFSSREAIELANVLNNPLEFELVVDDMYSVTPSLAHDARANSIYAGLLGAALVILFMFIFYMRAGTVAVIATLLNVVVVLGVLASMGGTLTLPGVAALVLTVGMAVDANILIFERIREELQAGKSVANALKAGYEKALSTIVDANVTTFITALILIGMGTGPVKGFGYTLAVGIGASMFGALVISRAMLELLVVKNWSGNLIPPRFKGAFYFVPMAFGKQAFMVSWGIVLMGVIAIGIRGHQIFGIDFLGGAEVTFEFNQKARDDLQVTEILALADRENLGEVQPVFQKLLGEAEERLKLQVDAEQGRVAEVVAAMQAAFPQAELTKVSENVIGAAVSENVRWNAIYSVALALVGILLYVALRFEFGFGIGAVVATVHDVLMTIGIFVILGLLDIGSGQFTAPMVAAILMIVGYSINDTIVVFDRIREELELQPNATLFDIVNFAVNRTLSRTLLTSVTTLFAAISLFVFGAGVVQDYALVFIIGILTGTFSSIFIASPVFYWWHKGSRKHVEERELTRPSYDWEIGGARQAETKQ